MVVMPGTGVLSTAQMRRSACSSLDADPQGWNRRSQVSRRGGRDLGHAHNYPPPAHNGTSEDARRASAPACEPERRTGPAKGPEFRSLFVQISIEKALPPPPPLETCTFLGA